MTLYFDNKVQFLDSDAVSTVGRWHPREAVFAVASYSQDRGGSVTIFDDSGEPLRNVTYPVHSVSQATALCWHSEKRLLVSGWENGEIHTWYDGNREFSTIRGPHKSPIIILEFSEQGGRMVTGDSMGLLTGWRCDGQNQFLTMFSHDLRDTLLHVTFRRTVQSQVNTELSNLARAAVAGDESALDMLTNWRPRTAARNLSHSGVKDNHCFYVGTQSGTIFYLNQAGTCVEVLKNSSSPITQILWHPKREAIVALMEDLTVGHYTVESTGSLVELDRVKLSGRIPGNNGAISWAGHSLAIITGDFSVRIWDMDTSDNYLLKMELPTTTGDSGAGKSDLPSANQKIANGGIGKAAIQAKLSSSTMSGVSGIGLTKSNSGAGPISGQTIEIFTCIAYCQDNQTLCAGTNQGNLYTWKRTTNYAIDVPENSWQLNNISAVRGAIKQCYWGVSEISKPCVMVNCISNVYVLKEHPLISFHTREIWAIQRSANQVYVEHSCGKSTIVNADISITNLSLNESNLILSNGKTIATYKVSKDDELAESDKNLSIKPLQSFTTECLNLFIHEQNIFCLTASDVKIISLGGVVLKEIQCNDNEGKAIGCDLSNRYLTLFTMNGYIKIYDVSRHEPKPLLHPKSGYDLFEHFGEVIMAKSNSNGTRLAVTIANENLIPDGKLYIWDLEKDTVACYNFLDASSANSTGGSVNLPRLPISFCWDTDDNRLLAIEARSIQQQTRKLPVAGKNSSLAFAGNNQMDTNSNSINSVIGGHGATVQRPKTNVTGLGGTEMDKHTLMTNANNAAQNASTTIKSTTATLRGLRGGPISNSAGASAVVAGTTTRNGFGISTSSESSESQAFVMFTTDKCHIKELETVNLASGEQLVNLCAPHVITLNISTIQHIPLCDFKGLENCDESTRKMVLNFSLNVAEGNMDQAFRCIRSIQSEVVWTNLAKMCVQTGRLDVAKVCLGHLKRARSVRALRNAMADSCLEPDAKIAVLATELGMIEDAETLYKKCGRFDLLNKLMQACGKIDEGIQVAEQCDRVHMRNTYFQKAEFLKEKNDIKGAIEYYEKAQCSTQPITQMLLEDPAMLKKYMEKTTDAKMLKWWGQYIESTGDMDSAFIVYQKADDWFSQVRILCFLGQLSKADKIARQSGDRAACYHLARHYENIGKYQEAIHFYTRAQTYSNAVRICKENDFQEDLWTVASAGRNRDKAIAAAYFEECGVYKRAVELYHRSGMLHKAVEMAFASQQPETLQVIASELNAESDPDLVSRCADFFTSIEQHQKAVQLLAKAEQFGRAIQICQERHVPITESLADLLTPQKGAVKEDIRQKVLLQLGELLQEQGEYHSATKKFTQAGDKIRAMKSLLKSGDTEKIVFFAGMSRQREVYIMAANYLQALNWQSDPKILKSIVTFYTKGQAYDSLANFYATCAQVEIDEFRDYEKALKAMQEAAKCLTKVPNSQRATDNLQNTIVEVKHVLNLQESLDNGNNQAAVAGCRSLLVKPEKPPVRQSHILVILIEALTASKLFSEALGALRELAIKDPSWSANGLISKTLVQKLSAECDIDFESIWNSGGRQEKLDSDQACDDSEEEIQEEVEVN